MSTTTNEISYLLVTSVIPQLIVISVLPTALIALFSNGVEQDNKETK